MDTNPVERRQLSPAPPAPLMVPDYAGACLSTLLPALQMGPGHRPSWLPTPLAGAAQVALLVVDGLGWQQLRERAGRVPLLASLPGRPITSVAPSTTAVALASLTLGRPPAEHGIVGYKFAVDGPSGREVLNVLRWSTSSGDARPFLPPDQLQPLTAFGGRPVPVVTRADFMGTGFSLAHQRGGREVGWVVPSSLPALVGHLLRQGEPLVYAYYDGLDKVAHATGLGELYDAELLAVERMVSDLLATLPAGAALVVTADHGQVEVGASAATLAPEVVRATTMTSGEARFRWAHSLPGQQSALLALLRRTYGGQAWVATREEVVSAGVLGGALPAEVGARLGDVALVPLGDQAFIDPRDAGDARLVCRHGGLSPAELEVPLLVGTA